MARSRHDVGSDLPLPQDGVVAHDAVFVHLLNDFSGSPKVLCNVIRVARWRGLRPKLFVGSQGEGILSHSELPVHRYWYRRSRYRALTLLSFLFSQIALLIRLLLDKSIERRAVVYVNTLLPFGAMLFGRLTHRRVILHVHEISLSPRVLQWTLVALARRCASRAIFVSDAHLLAVPLKGVPTVRVYNALEPRFLSAALASTYSPHRQGRFTVLMIASLRDYKGVPEFLALAEAFLGHVALQFELLVNDELTAVERYFARRGAPTNVRVHSRTPDSGALYEGASLVLNLSRVDRWIETFGLTILEALAYGIPVIAPPIGGPAEIVQDGVQGYLIDSRDGAALRNRVAQLSADPPTCHRLSAAARKRAADFSPEHFRTQIAAILEDAQDRRS